MRWKMRIGDDELDPNVVVEFKSGIEVEINM